MVFILFYLFHCCLCRSPATNYSNAKHVSENEKGNHIYIFTNNIYDVLRLSYMFYMSPIRIQIIACYFILPSCVSCVPMCECVCVDGRQKRVSARQAYSSIDVYPKSIVFVICLSVFSECIFSCIACVNWTKWMKKIIYQSVCYYMRPKIEATICCNNYENSMEIQFIFCFFFYHLSRDWNCMQFSL